MATEHTSTRASFDPTTWDNQTWKVVSYDEGTGNHELRHLKTGYRIHCDLFVIDNIGKPTVRLDYCKSLVGKEVTIKSMNPYVTIATGVTVLEPTTI